MVEHNVNMLWVSVINVNKYREILSIQKYFNTNKKL